MKRKLSFLPFLLIAFAGCTTDTIYSHYRHIADEEWGRSDTLIYIVPGIQHGGTYDLAVGLRTTSGYPYSDLTFVVEQEMIPSGRHSTDTFKVSLTTQDTRVQQNGTGVALRQYHFPFKQLTLTEGDTLKLTLKHDMQRDPLPGVADVGITLQR